MTKHSIIFSGHMIDATDRETPRFPASKEIAAINSVRTALGKLLKDNEEPRGFAGGACGGDIIFHEICQEKNIPSVILLALNPKEFIEQSVSFAGANWVARFEKLCKVLPVSILPAELPGEQSGLNIWERGNEWIMQSALEYSADPCSLVAIWDGKGADGPGGTKHMVEEIQIKQQRTIIIDPAELPETKK